MVSMSDTINVSVVAARMRARRAFLNMTLDDVAKGVQPNLSMTHLSRIESEKVTRIEGDTIDRIAAALKTTREAILGTAPMDDLGTVKEE